MHLGNPIPSRILWLAVAALSTIMAVALMNRYFGALQHRPPVSDEITAPQSDLFLASTKSIELSRRTFREWMHLLEILAFDRDSERKVRTDRVGCREYEAGAQSCVFEGVSCVNVGDEGNAENDKASQAISPIVWVVDDYREEGCSLPGDDWCEYRYQSADPRYFGPRHWPIRNGTVAPQWSCMNGIYVSRARVKESEEAGRVRWVESMSLVNLDYPKNNHNNHALKDLVHLLDTALWVESLDTRGGPTRGKGGVEYGRALFETKVKHVFLPQSESDFLSQTSRDVNRLNYAIILREDLKRLYPNSSEASLKVAQEKRYSAQLFQAFPGWKKDERLLFWGEMRKDKRVDLVCTSRLTVGSKLGDMGHERVCREVRQKGWELFGITPPSKVRVGQIYYNQPPRRIVVLQRHRRRSFGNLQALMDRLHAEFNGSKVEIELVSSSKLRTAEDFVRIFSRAGVLLTPHGSQAMGQIWMPRHATLIEVMPVGYTDYTFNLMADKCKIWYEELQSTPGPNMTALYESRCAEKTPHMLNPCIEVKHENVFVPLDDAVRVIKLSLERMGHQVGSWLS